MAHHASADYWAAGDVEVSIYYDVPHGMESRGDEVHPTEGRTSINLSESFTGPNGNSADAMAVANLALGRLGSYGSGMTPGVNMGIGTGRATSRFQDTLTFTVAPGTYDNDMIARISGHVSGSFTLTGPVNTHPSGNASFTARFGAANSVSFDWDDTDGAIYQPFELSRKLVNAGTLTEPYTVSTYVRGMLNVTGQSNSNYASSGTSDFFNSAQFAVEVPDGVSWTSESGIFLSQVPVPGAVWLLGSGLVGLVGLRRKLKK